MHFNVFLFCQRFIFRANKIYVIRGLFVISCEIVKRKYVELSIHANIYLSVFNIGSVSHRLNYRIKVSL